MEGTSKKPEVSNRVVEEHLQIQQGMGRLQSFSAREVTAEEFADWRLELIWQLRDFKNLLLKHFDLEEEGGFMRDVLRQVPNAESSVEELRHEHDEMEASLDRLLALLKKMQEVDDQQLERLRAGLGDLATTLGDHESTEQHLLQRTYYRDYGGPE